MLRILRCQKSQISPKSLSYALYADDFKNEIKRALGEEYAQIISKPELSGDYVNFITPLSGELDKVTDAIKSNIIIIKHVITVFSLFIINSFVLF